MKTKVLVILLSLTIVPAFSEVAKLQSSPKPDPAYKLKYKELKQSLEITDKELTPVEILEVIALRYAEKADMLFGKEALERFYEMVTTTYGEGRKVTEWGIQRDAFLGLNGRDSSIMSFGKLMQKCRRWL